MFKKLPFASPQAQIHDLSQTEPWNYSGVPGLHSSSHTWASQTSDSQLSNRRCVAEQQTVGTTAQWTHRTDRLILPSWCWHFQKQWLNRKGSSRSSASVAAVWTQTRRLKLTINHRDSADITLFTTWLPAFCIVIIMILEHLRTHSVRASCLHAVCVILCLFPY